MVIVRFQGGIGNQFFQYALYRKFECLGKNVKADLSWYRLINKNYQRNFKLKQFGINILECSKREKWEYSNEGKSKLYKVRRIIFGNKSSHVYEKNISLCDEEIFKEDNIYLDGYWQTEKYFEDIQDILRNEIRFPTICIESNALLREIENSNSVSLHVRRGDYILPNSMYSDCCTVEYYRDAMKFLNEKYSNLTFYVFSDELDWCKNYIIDENVRYVSKQPMEEDYVELILMSKCKHNIIANSSFSWWAAWLNFNIDKDVIAPSRWTKGHSTDDIWCEEWIKL